MKRNTEVLWVERHRPQTLADCVLSPAMRETLEGYVTTGTLPTLLLSGRPGIGKTTVAHCLLNDLGVDPLVINGSLERNIDTLRTVVAEHARYKSFDGKRKYVLIDEADGLNAQSTQPALRAFMEDNSKNCGFVLTCNDINLIHPAIQSRCTTLNFAFSPDEKIEVSKAVIKRLAHILRAEGKKPHLETLARLTKKMFPDIRRIINELQGYLHGPREALDEGILKSAVSTQFEGLMTALKANNFDSLRKWCAENGDLLDRGFFTTFYEQADGLVAPESIPQFVITLGEHQETLRDGMNPEIHFVKMLTWLMKDTKWR